MLRWTTAGFLLEVRAPPGWEPSRAPRREPDLRLLAAVDMVPAASLSDVSEGEEYSPREPEEVQGLVQDDPEKMSGFCYDSPSKRPRLDMRSMWSTVSTDVGDTSGSSGVASSSPAGRTSSTGAGVDLSSVFDALADGQSMPPKGGNPVVFLIRPRPRENASMTEKINWAFDYALRKDQPWLNFGLDSARRIKGKRLPLGRLIGLYLVNNEYIWDIKFDWKMKRSACDAMVRWYARGYEESVHYVRKFLAEYWNDVSPAEVTRWIFIQRLAAVLYTPSTSAPGKVPTRIAIPKHVEAAVQNGVDTNPIICTTVGVLVTYNVKAGEQHPTVLRWIQEGLSGSDLTAKLVTLPLYQDLFKDFVDFQFAEGARVGFTHCGMVMEHSRHGKHPARVHLHAFHCPEVRWRTWDHAVKPMIIHKGDFRWMNCHPDLRPCIVKNRFRGAALGQGLYYVTGKKLGTMFRRTTLEPFVDLRESRLHDMSCRRRTGGGQGSATVPNRLGWGPSYGYSVPGARWSAPRIPCLFPLKATSDRPRSRLALWGRPTGRAAESAPSFHPLGVPPPRRSPPSCGLAMHMMRDGSAPRTSR